jgi:hypothetical protein
MPNHLVYICPAMSKPSKSKALADQRSPMLVID